MTAHACFRFHPFDVRSNVEAFGHLPPLTNACFGSDHFETNHIVSKPAEATPMHKTREDMEKTDTCEIGDMYIYETHTLKHRKHFPSFLIPTR